MLLKKIHFYCCVFFFMISVGTIFFGSFTSSTQIICNILTNEGTGPILIFLYNTELMLDDTFVILFLHKKYFCYTLYVYLLMKKK